MVDRSIEYVELTLQLHSETAKAMLLSDTGEEADAEWVPISQLKEINKFMRNKQRMVAADFPEWLAKDKGFI